MTYWTFLTVGTIIRTLADTLVTVFYICFTRASVRTSTDFLSSQYNKAFMLESRAMSHLASGT